VTDLSAPYSQWTRIKTFPTEKECHEHAGEALSEYQSTMQAASFARQGISIFVLAVGKRNVREESQLRCVATNDPRMNGLH
jgi:hypothetical protein